MNETVYDVLDEMNSTYLMEEMSVTLEKMRVFDVTSCGLTAQNELRFDQCDVCVFINDVPCFTCVLSVQFCGGGSSERSG